MDNQLTTIGFRFFETMKYAIILILLFVFSNSYGQSEFYSSSIGEIEKAKAVSYYIGDEESEREVKATKLKYAKVLYKYNADITSTSTAAEILNENSKITHLSFNTLSSDYNSLSIDFENLKYVKYLEIRISNQFDLDLLWTKLNQMVSLKEIKLEGARNPTLKLTNEFSMLVSKLNRLEISRLNVDLENAIKVEHSLETLILMNIHKNSKTERSLLGYLVSSTVKELVFKSRDLFTSEDSKEFEGFNNLERLYFQVSKTEKDETLLTNISSSLEYFTLVSIHNSFSSKGIGQLTNLKELDVRMSPRGSKVDPQELTKLIKLKKLSCTMSSVGENLGNLNDLEELKLYGTYESIPESISKLTKLEKVHFRSTKLKYLPKGLGKLKSLRYLKIENSILEELPNEIGDLKKLEELKVSANLTSIPSEIGDLKKLKILDLTDNQLLGLPSKIGKLNSLETLKIGGEESNASKVKGDLYFEKVCINVDGLPKEIFKIKNLKTLDISSTKVTDSQFGDLLTTAIQNNCAQLSINLSSCGISKFPSGDFKNLTLKKLDLTNNSISEITKPFYLAQINSLILTKNKNYFPASGDRGLNLIAGFFDGILEKEDFSVSDSLPWAIGRNKFFDLNMKLYDLLYSVDPINTESQLDKNYLADYHFFNGDFEKANKVYASLIQSSDLLAPKNEISIDYRARNSWIRYLVSLKNTKDVDKCIEMLKKSENYVDTAFTDQGNTCFNLPKVYLSMLYKGIDDTQSDLFSDKAFERFTKYAGVSSTDISKDLDYLEMCLVTGKLNEFDTQFRFTLIHKFKDENHELIMEYLKQLRDLVSNQINESSIERFDKLILETKAENLDWDTSMAEIWSYNFNDEKANRIRELNRVINPKLNYYPAPLLSR